MFNFLLFLMLFGNGTYHRPITRTSPITSYTSNLTLSYNDVSSNIVHQLFIENFLFYFAPVEKFALLLIKHYFN